MIETPFETPPGPGEAIEIADGVLWLRIPLPMVLDHVNVYALREDAAAGGGWAIVDTGLNSKRTRAGWQAALEGPLAGAPITRVLVTHHHPDHVGLAAWFQEQGAELLMTRTAWLFARMLTLDNQDRATDAQITFWRRAGMPPEILASRSAERPFNFADIVAPMPLGFTRLIDGQALRFGARDWIVRFGQGHAPDHATLWSQSDNLVLAGDQILPSISPNIGVYATEPEADPVGDWLTACAELTPHARADHIVLPGHKRPFTGLPDRMRQLSDHHTLALDRLRLHLDQARRATECFAPLFKRKIDAGTYGHALVEAVAHLNHLHRLGEVSRSLGDDGAWLWRRKD